MKGRKEHYVERINPNGVEVGWTATALDCWSRSETMTSRRENGTKFFDRALADECVAGPAPQLVRRVASGPPTICGPHPTEETNTLCAGRGSPTPDGSSPAAPTLREGDCGEAVISAGSGATPEPCGERGTVFAGDGVPRIRRGPRLGESGGRGHRAGATAQP
jgi:hypothetical protein